MEEATVAEENGKLVVVGGNCSEPVVVNCSEPEGAVVRRHIQVVEGEMGMEEVNRVWEKVVEEEDALHKVVEKGVEVVLYKVGGMVVVVNGQGEEENGPEEVAETNRDRQAVGVSEEGAEANGEAVEANGEAAAESCNSKAVVGVGRIWEQVEVVNWGAAAVETGRNMVALVKVVEEMEEEAMVEVVIQ